MKTDSKAAFGIYRNDGQIQTAEKALQKCGFQRRDISILHPQHKGAQDFGQRVETLVRPFATVGSVLGALTFMFLGLLIGGGVIPLPSMTTNLTNAGLTLVAITGLIVGAFMGGAIGALVGAGTPQTASRRYINYLHSGGILMSVHVESAIQSRQASEVLEKTGAQDITFLDENDGWRAVSSHI
jgi:hypothetical protein